MQRLSVVIPNYNYERFVGQAVESALNLDWPDVEVIVVDDGSTDRSADVLRAMGDRIRLHVQENAGQRAAVNTGFALSTGDVVVFLDSDDLLPRGLPQAVHRLMSARVSKVQLQAQRIDERGAPIGAPFPAYRRTPDPTELRRWMMRTTAYPTPPGSANAYARWFLERIMPVGDFGDRAADSALLAAAPLLGDVVAVPGVLVGYRRHGANDSGLLVDPKRFAREVRRAQGRWRFAESAAGLVPSDAALRRSRELLQLRASAIRIAPGETALRHDRRIRIMVDSIRSPFHPGPEPLPHRVVVMIWSLAVLIAPLRLARRLVGLRYRESS